MARVEEHPAIYELESEMGICTDVSFEFRHDQGPIMAPVAFGKKILDPFFDKPQVKCRDLLDGDDKSKIA